ncbi:YhcB family protein [Marinimicrobium locisalis]|uniref:YhcB family protein n=1 Tax=Marinimicrobium locisalis TaxID=546022 RepID=UPI0032217BF4
MFSFGTLIITALLCLLGGAALGAVLFKLVSPSGQNRELEERVQRAENELKQYQQDVAEHFAQTSSLVNNLTQSYREVYEHLANSALKLTTPALSRQILESANTELLGSEKTYLSEEHVEVPRDWAPKQGTGQLSEEYGLHEDTEHPSPYHFGSTTAYVAEEDSNREAPEPAPAQRNR